MTAENLRSGFETFALEQMRWAHLAVSMQEVAQPITGPWVRDLSRFDQTETVSRCWPAPCLPFHATNRTAFDSSSLLPWLRFTVVVEGDPASRTLAVGFVSSGRHAAP